MEIEQAIINRRAIYTGQFSGETVPEEYVKRMLELANWAPTHKHTEPWRFQVYEAEAKNRLIDKIKEIYIRETAAEQFNAAVPEKWERRKSEISHIVPIIMKRHEHVGIPKFEEVASVAMAVQNMWLYLASLQRVGGYWSTPAPVLNTSFAEFLQLRDDERCLGIFIIGMIKKDGIEPVGQRKDWQQKVTWHKN